MRVFLTGASGFVGTHVARALYAAGADLRLLVRSTSRTEHLQGFDPEFVVGDLTQPKTLKTALSGCDALVHVAADYRLWTPNPEPMYAANVEGTRTLLSLARENRIRRIVYTSSVATMGFRPDGTVINEASPVYFEEMIGHYKRSKFLAEEIALEASQTGQHIIVLNPTTPIGSEDFRPTPTGRIIVDFLKRNFPAYVDTGLNFVDVEAVAAAHVAAFDYGKPGRRYILGGENLTLKQFLDRMAGMTGLPSPKLRVPHSVAMGFAFFDEWVNGRLRKKEPRATVEAVKMGKKKMFASSQRAERELNYKVLPIDHALKSAIEWFRANGYAPNA